MKIEFPFCYSVSVQLPRNRNLVDRRRCRSVVVEIPELRDDEAPVAVSWQERGMYVENGAEIPVSVQMQVRNRDGYFYRPVVFNHFAPEPIASVEQMGAYKDGRVADALRLAFCRDVRTQPISTVMQLIANDHIKIVERNERVERAAQVLGSNLDTTMAKVEEALSEYIVVDGNFWKRVSEPVIVLDTESMALGVTSESVTWGRQFQADNERIKIGGSLQTVAFRMDQFDDAIGYIKRKREETGRLRQVNLSATQVQVFMPEELAFDPSANAVSRQASECAMIALQKMTRDGDRAENLLSLVRLADDHLTAHETDGDPNDLTLAVTAVVDLYAAMGPRFARKREHAAALEALLGLQDDLPVSVEIAPRRP